MSSLFDKLDQMEDRYQELLAFMAQPEVAVDYEQIQILGKEAASLEDTINLYREYRRLLKLESDAQGILLNDSDPDLAILAQEELDGISQAMSNAEQRLKMAILPRDPNDDRNVIVEIRKGTGGQEAAVFAGDLFRMYSRYSQIQGWNIEVMNSNPSDLGGFNEIIFAVKGRGAFSHLKFESGVHRVQRVPSTEASGRLHTSTATIAVLPEVEEVEIKLSPDDLRIDVFHAGGHGGQNVNKVASAIRIVHLPTGIVAVCQDERSQFKNKQKAMSILRARLYAMEQRKQDQAIVQSRRAQVGSGERSEKIRTYNFPHDRITDYRVDHSLFGIQKLLAGEMNDLIQALVADEQIRRLDQVLET